MHVEVPMRLPVGAVIVIACLGGCGDNLPPDQAGDGGGEADGGQVTHPALAHLTAVWGSGATGLWPAGGAGATDVWAVGELGTILYWDGTSWVSVESGTTVPLFGVWGSASTDVWIVGDSGTILHWEGTSWASVESGTTKPLFGVWGSASTDVWIVGDSGTILHWEGVSWVPIETFVTSELRGLWGSSATDVWAVGGQLLHWDGADWAEYAYDFQGPAGSFYAAWGSGPDDIWAVGEWIGGGGWSPGSRGGLLAHWDGASWSGPSGSTTTPLPLGVWGSASNDVWAVADNGGIFHFDGSKWTSDPHGTYGRLQGVWGASASDVWAVGYAFDTDACPYAPCGAILHWSGVP
jgi:hypothetical protein